MKYYDIVFDSCRIEDGIEAQLGFSRIFRVGKENREAGIFAGTDMKLLNRAMQDGAAALAITNFMIDRELISKMADRGIALCIGFAPILSRWGIPRSKLLYRAAALLKYANSKRMEVSFASLAESELYLNSGMQLTELAKSIGATEEQARRGMGEVNKQIGEIYDKAKA